jgi:hypothetical protein
MPLNLGHVLSSTSYHSFSASTEATAFLELPFQTFVFEGQPVCAQVHQRLEDNKGC